MTYSYYDDYYGNINYNVPLISNYYIENSNSNKNINTDKSGNKSSNKSKSSNKNSNKSKSSNKSVNNSNSSVKNTNARINTNTNNPKTRIRGNYGTRFLASKMTKDGMYYIFDSRKKPTFDKQYGRNIVKEFANGYIWKSGFKLVENTFFALFELSFIIRNIRSLTFLKYL